MIRFYDVLPDPLGKAREAALLALFRRPPAFSNLLLAMATYMATYHGW